MCKYDYALLGENKQSILKPNLHLRRDQLPNKQIQSWIAILIFITSSTTINFRIWIRLWKGQFFISLISKWNETSIVPG